MVTSRTLALGALAVVFSTAASGQQLERSAPSGSGDPDLRPPEASSRVPAPGPTQPMIASELGFGIRLQAGFSDNFNLRPKGRESSGRAIEASPYVEGYLRTARSRGDLALQLRGIWYAAEGSSHSRINPDLRANGDLSLYEDAFRIAGSAQAFRNAASPFSAASVDPGSRGGDAGLYKAYAISPYSLGRFGNSEYELRYRTQYIDPGNATPSSVSQQFALGLASSRDSSSALGWSANANTGRVDFEDDSGFRRSSAELLGYVGLSPRLRIGAGINYSHINVLVNSDGDNKGYGPTGFLGWRPGPRTMLTAKYADTFYGNESSLRLTHEEANWVFGLGYLKGLQTGTESGLLFFDPDAIFALPESRGSSEDSMIRRMAQQRIISGAGQPLLFGMTGSSLVYHESIIVSLGLVRPRNSLVLTLFSNEQQPARTSLPDGGMTLGITQRGASLMATHRLDSRTSIFLSPSYLVSESDETAQEAQLVTVSLGWVRTLAPRTSLSVTLRASRQESRGATPSDEYVERAVFVGVDHRFR